MTDQATEENKQLDNLTDAIRQLTYQSVETQKRLDQFDGQLHALHATTTRFSELASRQHSARVNDSSAIGGQSLPGHFNPTPGVESQNNPQGIPHGSAQGAAFINSAALDVQGEFQTIRDTVNNVKLPADLKVPDSKQGIKREDQQHSAVVAKCARYAETTLKLLFQAGEPANVTEDTLIRLYHVQLAQVRYLQEEHASLIVQGQFDRNTARLYRTLQRNTSAFNEESLATLRNATTIAAAYRPPRFSNNQGRGRGSYSRGYQGGRYNFNRRDIPSSNSQPPHADHD